MKLFWTLIGVLFSVPIWLHAQNPPQTVTQTYYTPVNITGFEYRFQGNNQWIATTGSVSPSNNPLAPFEVASKNQTISIEGLKPGFNTLLVRSVDQNGVKGIPKIYRFYVPAPKSIATVASARYSFNQVSGTGTGTAVSSVEEKATVSNRTIPLTGLTVGFHSLYVRLIDQNGLVGIPKKISFYLPAASTNSPISKLEYFVGKTDPGYGRATSVTISQDDDNDIVENQSLSLANLPSGFHTFNFRAGDETGSWSPIRSSLLYIPKPVVASENITEVEFFTSAGTLPAPGDGTAMQAKTEFDSSTVDSWAITKVTAPPGSLLVYARAKDASGQWGVPAAKQVEVFNKRVVEGYLSLNGSRIGGRAVTLTGPNSFTSTIDSRDEEPVGFFQFSDLEAGKYTLVAQGQRDSQTNILASSDSYELSLGAVPDVKVQDLSIEFPAYVTSVSPRANATDLGLEDNISIRYSDKIDAATATGSNIYMTSDLRGKMNVAITLANGDSTIVINPSVPFLVNEELTVTVTKNIGIVGKTNVLPFQQRFRTKPLLFSASAYQTEVLANSSGAFSVIALDVADFDNNSSVDIAYVTTDGLKDNLFIVSNLGNKTFGNVKLIQIDATGKLAVNGSKLETLPLLKGDFDLDGDIDLIHIRSGSRPSSPFNSAGIISVIKNNGNSFAISQTLEKESSPDGEISSVLNAQLRDLNSDGYPDLIIYFLRIGRLVYYNNGSGTFGNETIDEAVSYTSVQNADFADITGDGAPDWIQSGNVGNQLTHRYIPYENGSLSSANSQTFAFQNGSPYDYFVYDFNQDGKNDLIANMGVGLYVSLNSGNFSSLFSSPNFNVSLVIPTNDRLAWGFKINQITPAQINTSDRLEFFYITQGNQAQTISWDSGSSSLVKNVLFSAKSGLVSREIAAADFDSDGDVDFVYGTYSNSSNNAKIGEIYVQFSEAQSANETPVFTDNSDAFVGPKTVLLEDNPVVKLTLTDFFTDPDEDDLSFTALSSNATVASATISVDTLIATGLKVGSTVVTVTARDGKGGQVAASFQLSVNSANNAAPTFVGTINNIEINVGDNGGFSIDNLFNDPDEEDVLTFSASSSNESAVTVSILSNSGNSLSYSGVAAGTSTITLSAEDNDGANVSVNFEIAVTELENLSPIVTVAQVPDSILVTTRPNMVFNLYNFFEDDRNALTFEASNVNSSSIQVSITNSTMTVAPIAEGINQFSVTATDDADQSVSLNFIIRVVEIPLVDNKIGSIDMVTQTSDLGYPLTLIFPNHQGNSSPYNINIQSSSNTIGIAYASASQIFFRAQSEGVALITVKATRNINGTIVESATADITLRVKNRVFQSQTSNSSSSFYANGIVVQKWGLLSIPGSVTANTPLEIFDELGSSDAFRLFDLSPNNGEPVFNGYEDVTNSSGNPFSAGKGLWFKTLATSSPFTLETPAGARLNQRSVLSESFIGYAFISTPFDVESYWIRNNTSINVQLWSFDPDSEEWISVTESQKLKPWTAYVAFSPVSSAIVHYLDNFKTVDKEIASEMFSHSSASWRTQLLIDETILSFGDIDGGESGLDNYDRALPLPNPNQTVTPPSFVVNGLNVSDDYRTPKYEINEQILDYRTLRLSKGHHSISANFEGGTHGKQALLLTTETFRKYISEGDTLTIDLAKETNFKVYSGSKELLEEIVVPETITLYAAYPNPFNPSTTLRFSLPEQSQINLEVYDVLGRKVASLVNEVRSAGFHTVTFDASELSSGVYMYRLSAGANTVLVRKMTLIK